MRDGGHYHYAKSEGIVRRQKRERRQEAAIAALLAGKVQVKLYTASEIRDTLERRTKLERLLQTQLRSLPRGDERKAAVRACVAADLTQTEIAVLMDVSRQRVGQLVAEAEECPL